MSSVVQRELLLTQELDDMLAKHAKDSSTSREGFICDRLAAAFEHGVTEGSAHDDLVIVRELRDAVCCRVDLPFALDNQLSRTAAERHISPNRLAVQILANVDIDELASLGGSGAYRVR